MMESSKVRVSLRVISGALIQSLSQHGIKFPAGDAIEVATGLSSGWMDSCNEGCQSGCKDSCRDGCKDSQKE